MEGFDFGSMGGGGGGGGMVPWDAIINNNNRKYEVGWKSTQKVLSQQAIDKLIYDVMSSDQGLAALAAGENLSGGSKSSSKTLLGQDMMTKLIGELASVTAETKQQQDMTTDKESKQGRKLSVICTELNYQKLLSDELYEAGGPPSRQVSYLTWKGYYSWAQHVVPKMKESNKLSAFLLPIVVARYEHLLGRRFSILGATTIYVGHPICWMIGALISVFSRNQHGRFQSTS